METAKQLLGQGRELNAFMNQLMDDIANLKAMLHAISIGEPPFLLPIKHPSAFRVLGMGLVHGSYTFLRPLFCCLKGLHVDCASRAGHPASFVRMPPCLARAPGGRGLLV